MTAPTLTPRVGQTRRRRNGGRRVRITAVHGARVDLIPVDDHGHASSPLWTTLRRDYELDTEGNRP